MSLLSRVAQKTKLRSVWELMVAPDFVLSDFSLHFDRVMMRRRLGDLLINYNDIDLKLKAESKPLVWRDVNEYIVELVEHDVLVSQKLCSKNIVDQTLVYEWVPKEG